MSATGRSDVRVDGDFYETPAWCTDAILPRLWRHPYGLEMWLDPCCGTGAIAKRIKAFGVSADRLMCIELDVARALTATDSLGFVNVQSFLDWAPKHGHDSATHVVMNPPFSKALEFVDAALSCLRVTGGEVAALLRLNFLAGQKRAAWWRAHPADVYVLPRRPSFTGSGTDATDYAWFVWGSHRGNSWQILDVETIRGER